MYQALLTRRYLTTKIMPLLAALAVTLCVATEMVVWSVMGGFLAQFVESGRRLVGDVTISWPIAGLPHYEDLRRRLEADPEVAATAPVVETYGLISLPDGRTDYVVVKGIDGPSYARVTDYASTLQWKPLDVPMPKDKWAEDYRLRPLSELQRLIDWPGYSQAQIDRAMAKTWEEVYRDGLELFEVDPKTGERVPAVVLGIEVSGFNVRRPGGMYLPGIRTARRASGQEEEVRTFLPSTSITLSLLPLDSSGRVVNMTARPFPVANEFQTGLLQIDERTVLAEIGTVQRMLKMDAGRRLSVPAGPAGVVVGPGGEEEWAEEATTGESPARVTSVYVRGAGALDAQVLAERCRGIYRAFAAAHAGEVPDPSRIVIRTWRDENAVFIGAVEKETILVMFIFGIISLTSVFLVLAIFWAMVSEKTRDIGVLRAVGAGKLGVASIWLTYGLLIGAVGAALGTLLAWVIVTNINPIHEWLGEALGIQVWDPKVYYFTTIPSRVNPAHAALVAAGGVLASVLGALWPAARAANMDPVKALRFE